MGKANGQGVVSPKANTPAASGNWGDEVTPKERVYRALAHEETDLVPYMVSIEPGVAARVDEYYGNTDWRRKIVNHAVGTGPNWRGPERPDGTFVDKFGSVWQQGTIFHLIGYPLTEPTLKGYEFPDLLEEDTIERMAQFCETHQDRFRYCNFGLMFFERSWSLRGMENILVDFLEHPDFVEELFDGLMELHLDLMDRLGHLPFDAFGFGDDFGQQKGLIMGPRIWRRVLKPRLARMYGKAHELGKRVHIHTCGDVSEIMEDLIEIGVDICNPFQPEAMDVFDLKRRYGDRITFEGGIGTQVVLPYGTPEEVRAEVRRCREELGRGGGYIMVTTKPIMDHVPTENAVACIEEIIQPN